MPNWQDEAGARQLCGSCGEPRAAEALACHGCGSSEWTVGVVYPTRAPVLPTTTLPWPWVALGNWPEGSTVALDGSPGSGKSSLAALLKPSALATSEETAQQAMATFSRLAGVAPGEAWSGAPTLLVAETVEELQMRMNATMLEGLLVLDSLSWLRGDQTAALLMLIEWARAAKGRRVLIIVGHRKDGGALGASEVFHLTQVNCSVTMDEAGNRLLTVRKNRHGGLDSRYFRLTAAGVAQCTWPYAYSVEGEPGSYRLVPWPTRGAIWQDGLAARFRDEVASKAAEGVASCGRVVDAYKGGLLQPQDVAQRRLFAEAHGLRWVQ